MKPIKFKQSNKVYKAPKDFKGKCNDIDAYDGVTPEGSPIVVTVWELSDEDIERIKKDRKVWVMVHGTQLPPMGIHTETVFLEGKPEEGLKLDGKALGRLIELELGNIDKEHYARIWCELNRTEVSKDLEHIMPERFKVPGYRSEKMEAAARGMAYIEDEIGHKACLREWNRDRMTDEEFENFYGKWKREV